MSVTGRRRAFLSPRARHAALAIPDRRRLRRRQFGRGEAARVHPGAFPAKARRSRRIRLIALARTPRLLGIVAISRVGFEPYQRVPAPFSILSIGWRTPLGARSAVRAAASVPRDWTGWSDGRRRRRRPPRPGGANCARSSCASMNFCWVSTSILPGTDSGFFQSKPMRFISLISPERAVVQSEPLQDELPDFGGRHRQRLASPRRAIHRSGGATAHTTPPLQMEQDERLRHHSPGRCLEPAADGRSRRCRTHRRPRRRTSACSSSSTAFALRAMRCSSSPSLAILTRSARSAALRKLRFIFTRRLRIDPADSVKRFSMSEKV